ncbi:transglutaminase family protein [Oceanicola sp. D3]|uniref:transglutaminase-like domain-containing protein n=1 Tax=Oceanicola sp. D3 TaxID=2587163 RepID=UPI001121E41E|nr:transglutaminase family protein [Oceanicola sp. D3]QDC09365.1 transglutaminase family protein [Oceanicola sp. D3]
MLIRFGFEIDVACEVDVPMLLSLSTHPDGAGRLIGEDRVRTERDCPMTSYSDRFGNRITRVVAPEGTTRFWSDCVIEQDGAPDELAPQAWQHEIADLPNEVLSYLLPSRYCDSDALVDKVWPLFGKVTGWNRVQAICDFVHTHVTFGYQFGRADKTASEVFREKAGVCRDFAHLAIALCRAMNIPARYASGYLGDIGVPYSGPGDFSAWFEVYLGGRWYTFDARHNRRRIGRILMVRGSDASDCAIITSFGAHELTYFRVWTNELPDMSDERLHGLLAQRPEGAPLVYPSSARVG